MMPPRAPLENETREIQCELLWAIPKRSKAKKKIKLFEETFVIMLGEHKEPVVPLTSSSPTQSSRLSRVQARRRRRRHRVVL